MKKIISIILTASLILSTATMAFASQTDLNAVNSKINNISKQLSEGKKEEKKLTNQIKTLESSIIKAETEIGSLNTNIKATEAEIAKREADLKKRLAEINSKDATMAERLKVMYKNGDVGLLEIILGSRNFAELLTNLDMVKKIYEQDVDLLKFMEDQYSAVELEKQQLETLKASLATKKSEVDKKQTAMESDKEKVSGARKEVAADNKALEKQIDELNKIADQIAAEIRKAQSKEAYVGGELQWPAPGYTKITSAFGYRIHPILKVKKMHTGIDIGLPSGKSIVSANDGVVMSAGWNSGYGNVIMVDHGGGIVTLYAHCSKLLKSKGDKVKRGDTIAYCGSTGMSTGPHLHFEVRLDGDYKDPMGYLK